MGIDFSHSDAHWSYGGFHNFRAMLAEHEGIDLDQMQGSARVGDDGPRISWDTVLTPLKPLLDHSDCDGNLSPEDCAAIAPHLRKVVCEIWTNPDAYDRVSGLELADGMADAAAAGETFEFC